MRFFSLATICLALLTSCDEKAPDQTDTPTQGGPTATWPATLKTADGNFSVTLKPAKGEILENEHFSLDLSVTPERSHSGSFEVKVDADMPAHQHGMNTQPELVPLGDHKYRVDGMLFHMAGEWVIMVDVTNDGTTERASFPVLVE